MRDAELLWRSPEPELATRRLLRRLGLPEGDGGELRFADGTLLRGAAAEDPFDRLEVVAGRSAGGSAGAIPVPYEVLALGLASPVLRDQVGGGEPVPEPVLGARGVRFAAEWAPLVLLEPATEGRLAAFLARFGPAPCALYLRATAAAAIETAPERDPDDDGTASLGAAGEPDGDPSAADPDDGRPPGTAGLERIFSAGHERAPGAHARPVPGILGPTTLVHGGPAFGPFVLLVRPERGGGSTTIPAR